MFALRPVRALPAFSRESIPFLLRPLLPTTASPPVRAFSSTPASLDWLTPKAGHSKKRFKGSPRVATGGSTRGTTVVMGDYGMRMVDHHRRFSALQLRTAEEVIKRTLKGMRYKLYKRITANIPVFTKGNETRMGTGKGSFDFWASRVSVSRILFELKGEIHEKVAREAFRLAGSKLPGTFEFVKKGDYAVMGLMKLTPENTQKLIARKTKFPMQEGLKAFNPTAEEAVTGCTRVVKP